MIPVDQEYLHDMRINQHGDCFRACVASVLEMSREQVPHFAQESNGVASVFWNSAMDWLEALGWNYVHSPVDKPRDGYHFISGPSPRGGGIVHMVVGLNDEIIHDPHPSRDGLAGDRSQWRFSYLERIEQA